MLPRIVVLALVMAWPLQAFDEAVKERAQMARRPWLEAPMNVVTDGGRPVLLGGVVVALLAGAATRTVLIEAGVALIPVNLAVEALKYATNRPRPNGDHRRRNSAFPSSHVANAFALAVVLMRRWRRVAIPALLLAALVAVSRVYLNKHWCMDVVAGAGVGVALSWLAISQWRRWRPQLMLPVARSA